MKETIKAMSRTLIAVAAFFVLFGTVKNEAAAKVVQTAQTQNSITVNVTGYSSYYTINKVSFGVGADYNAAKANASAGQINNGKSLTYTFNNLQPGTEYCIAASVTYKSGSYTNTSVESAALVTLPGTVTGLNQEEWYRLAHAVNIVWNKQTGADGYEYRFMNDDGIDIEHSTTSSARLSVSHIKNNQVYKGTVRAYSTINGVKYYSDWCPTAYFMTQPAKGPTRGYENRELGASVSGGKLKVNWEKVKGINQYNVYVATKRGGAFKKVKTLGANKKSYTVKKVGKKKIKGNKTYYVYVEGVKIVNGNRYTTGLNYITQVKGHRTECLYVSSWK